MKTRVLKRCLMTAVMLLAISEMAIADDHERRGCLVNWTPQAFARGGQTRSGIPDVAYGDRGWDANRTYRQLVLLVSFVDCDFSFEDPQATYHHIFNTPGYTQRDGAGCVADYFRDQSNGLLNLAFDVYGPYKTNSKVKTGSSGRNEGHTAFREALGLLDAKGGFTISNAEQYASLMQTFMTDTQALREAGQRAGQYVQAESGATETIFKAVFA